MNFDLTSLLFGLMGGFFLAIVSGYATDIYNIYLRPKQFRPIPEPVKQPIEYIKKRQIDLGRKDWKWREVPIEDHQLWLDKGWEDILDPIGRPCINACTGYDSAWFMTLNPKKEKPDI